MAEYTPTYQKTAPLTIEHLEARVETLRGMHAYATSHDDVLVLDELFCAIVALEHRIMRWDGEETQHGRIATSLKELNRALKWAWLAREEEDHAAGMYAGKLKEAIAVVQELQVYLQSERQRAQESVEQQPEGMTREEAETLAATIRERLPQAEVEVHGGEQGAPWVVEARNPRRGTSQIFENPEQFEHLIQTAGRH